MSTSDPLVYMSSVNSNSNTPNSPTLKSPATPSSNPTSPHGNNNIKPRKLEWANLTDMLRPKTHRELRDPETQQDDSLNAASPPHPATERRRTVGDEEEAGWALPAIAASSGTVHITGGRARGGSLKEQGNGTIRKGHKSTNSLTGSDPITPRGNAKQEQQNKAQWEVVEQELGVATDLMAEQKKERKRMIKEAKLRRKESKRRNRKSIYASSNAGNVPTLPLPLSLSCDDVRGDDDIIDKSTAFRFSSSENLREKMSVDKNGSPSPKSARSAAEEDEGKHAKEMREKVREKLKITKLKLGKEKGGKEKVGKRKSSKGEQDKEREKEKEKEQENVRIENLFPDSGWIIDSRDEERANDEAKEREKKEEEERKRKQDRKEQKEKKRPENEKQERETKKEGEAEGEKSGEKEIEQHKEEKEREKVKTEKRERKKKDIKKDGKKKKKDKKEKGKTEKKEKKKEKKEKKTGSRIKFHTKKDDVATSLEAKNAEIQEREKILREAEEIERRRNEAEREKELEEKKLEQEQVDEKRLEEARKKREEDIARIRRRMTNADTPHDIIIPPSSLPLKGNSENDKNVLVEKTTGENGKQSDNSNKEDEEQQQQQGDPKEAAVDTVTSPLAPAVAVSVGAVSLLSLYDNYMTPTNSERN